MADVRWLFFAAALAVAGGCHSKARQDGPAPASSKTSALTAGDGGAFGAPCSADTDCASGTCFVGNQASYCSTHCSKDSDCPSPPSTGVCSKRGYCKNKP